MTLQQTTEMVLVPWPPAWPKEWVKWGLLLSLRHDEAEVGPKLFQEGVLEEDIMIHLLVRKKLF